MSLHILHYRLPLDMIHEELANNFTEVYFRTCVNSGYQVVFFFFFFHEWPGFEASTSCTHFAKKGVTKGNSPIVNAVTATARVKKEIRQ